MDIHVRFQQRILSNMNPNKYETCFCIKLLKEHTPWIQGINAPYRGNICIHCYQITQEFTSSLSHKFFIMEDVTIKKIVVWETWVLPCWTKYRCKTVSGLRRGRPNFQDHGLQSAMSLKGRFSSQLPYL